MWRVWIWNNLTRRIGGLGFVAYVRQEELPSFLSAIRAGGLPEYHIHPEGVRPEYFLIQYIEPIEKNRPALGYDIGTESTPCRRRTLP